MPDPTSATTAGIAIGLGTVTITGSIFGLQYDVLLAGFIGGLISLSIMPPMPRWKIAGSIAASAILAAYFAPILAAAALNFFPWLSAVGDFTRMSCAVVIGICWQPLLPSVMNRLRSLLNTSGGNRP